MKTIFLNDASSLMKIMLQIKEAITTKIGIAFKFESIARIHINSDCTFVFLLVEEGKDERVGVTGFSMPKKTVADLLGVDVEELKNNTFADIIFTFNGGRI